MIAKVPCRVSAKAHWALIVDDDSVTLSVLEKMLRNHGVANVVSACDGNDGAEQLDRQGHPDLIVCDLHMPGNDGFQFMESLRSRSFKGSLIVASGVNPRIMNSASLMAKFHHLNVIATLHKPVDPAALASALSTLHWTHATAG
jgi:CheY-like chemotaxis protein